MASASDSATLEASIAMQHRPDFSASGSIARYDLLTDEWYRIFVCVFWASLSVSALAHFRYLPPGCSTQVTHSFRFSHSIALDSLHSTIDKRRRRRTKGVLSELKRDSNGLTPPRTLVALSNRFVAIVGADNYRGKPGVDDPSFTCVSFCSCLLVVCLLLLFCFLPMFNEQNCSRPVDLLDTKRDDGVVKMVMQHRAGRGFAVAGLNNVYI